MDDEIPDDLETSDRYIAIPHKNDLDLGIDPALRYAADQLPDRYATVQEFFRRRGAYARFKDLVAAEGRLEQWYEFETEATENALKEWCAENGIHVVEKGHESSA